MDPLSHAAAAVLISNSLISPQENLVPLASALIASQIPDLDFLTKKLGSSTLFLKLHHKVGHSIFVLIPLGIVFSGVISIITGYSRFYFLTAIVLMTFLSHLLLDILIHGAGLTLFWPFTNNKFSVSLILGPNPLTSSARCSQRKLTVCLQCQLHGSLYIPLFHILILGALISLLIVHSSQVVAIVSLTAAFCYSGFCLIQKLKAKKLWQKELSKNVLKSLVAPGGYSPYLWFGLMQEGDTIETAYLNNRTNTVGPRFTYQNAPDNEMVRKSKKTKTVRDFLSEALYPHVSVRNLEGNIEVQWREISFAYSPQANLYMAKVLISPKGTVLYQEFRERWD